MWFKPKAPDHDTSETTRYVLNIAAGTIDGLIGKAAGVLDFKQCDAVELAEASASLLHYMKVSGLSSHLYGGLIFTIESNLLYINESK